MIELTTEFKKKVAEKLLLVRGNYDGSAESFSIQWGIKGSVFSRLKNGEVEGIISPEKWLSIGRRLNVNRNDQEIKIAHTDVYATIEEDMAFCQTHSKAMIFVDDCEIGKSVAARDLCLRGTNRFYIDCSQSKTKKLLIKALAKAIGVDSTGKYDEIKEEIKYGLSIVNQPLVVFDDAGDLEFNAFLELKEFWNAGEGFVGWYMIGDDSLKHKIEKAIISKKPGIRALFSRFSHSYSRATPIGRLEREEFYKTLLTQVANLNIRDKDKIDEVVKRCFVKGKSEQISGLRRLDSFIILLAA